MFENTPDKEISIYTYDYMFTKATYVQYKSESICVFSTFEYNLSLQTCGKPCLYNVCQKILL